MTQSIELSLPPSAELLFLVRTAVGAAATRADMTIEEIEDLHLAVDELCLLLMGPKESPTGRLVLRAEWTGSEVSVRCTLEGAEPDGAVAPPDEISQRILGALTDEHGIDLHGGARVGWLRKRGARTSAGA